LNLRTRTTDPLQGVTAFSYDANGNLLSVTDARNSVGSYVYDNMDRATTRRDPLLHDETYQYDLNGNLTQVTDRKEQVTSYSVLGGMAGVAGPVYYYSEKSNEKNDEIADICCFMKSCACKNPDDEHQRNPNNPLNDPNRQRNPNDPLYDPNDPRQRDPNNPPLPGRKN